MLRLAFPLASLLVASALASVASAQTFIEGFQFGHNTAGWTYNSPGESIQDLGGAPGTGYREEFLRAPNSDTFAPQLRTTADSPFHGNWRARAVQSFGLDLKTFSTQFPFQREVSLILKSGNCEVYTVTSDFVPQVGAPWTGYDIPIPSSSTTLPAGWNVLTSCGNGDATWNTVIEDVTEVRIFYGDPTFFFIFDIWDIGADELRITEGIGAAHCYTIPNSSGLDGRLVATGSAAVADNDLTIRAVDLPVNRFGYLVVSNGTEWFPPPGSWCGGPACFSVPPGSGMSSIGRFTSQIASSGSTGTITTFVDLAAVPSQSGPFAVQPGETWNFLLWHREDPAVCPWNFTAPTKITFR